MWRLMRISLVQTWAAATVLAVILLVGCDMPSLDDLDKPPNAGDSTLTIQPSTVNLAVNGTTTFTAAGGTPPYTFAIEPAAPEGGALAASGATAVYVAPATAGTYIVTVTDAADSVTEATVMATATVPLSVSPATITVAAGTTVELVASGGAGGYWFEKLEGSGILESSGPNSATYRAVNAESAQIRLHCGSDTADALLTLTEPPTLKIIPASVAIHVNTQFAFAATGGTGGYTYTCTGIGSVDPVTGTYTPGPNEGSATVTVTDDGGRTAPAAVVVSDPLDVMKLSPSVVHVVVGGTVTFTVSGGSPDYTYILSGAGSISPTGPTSQTTTLYTAPLVEGNGITLTVTDASTPLARTDTATIYVDPPPPLQINPATVILTTNEGVAFSATGGSGGYRYSIASGTGTINETSGLFTAPAMAEIDTVRVTDSGGRTADATVEIYFPLTIVPTDAFVPTNGTYTFSASGGKPPYSYTVTSSIGGAIESATGLYEAPPLSGSETVRVLDDLGNASYAVVTVYSPDWSVESVDTALKSGQHASLALDPLTDYPRVAYYDSVNKELRFVSWDGTSWSSEVVDTSASVGQYCSLALDSSTGYPRISYYDSSNRDLKYAAWNGSSWIVQVVDYLSMVGTFTSLALDPKTGYPRISYYDFTNKRLKYAEWDGTAWTLSVVDQLTGVEVGKYSSLALDSKHSRPRIAYYDSTNLKLKYAEWDGKSWTVVNPDPNPYRGQYCSLVLDADDRPRISYYNASTLRLWYAWLDGTIWRTEEVDPSAHNRGMYSSIALDRQTGNARIAYYDATDKKLVFVSSTGSGWNPPQDTMDPSTGVGTYASLRLDGDGRAVIAYYNSTAQDLKVAKEP